MMFMTHMDQQSKASIKSDECFAVVCVSVCN